MSGLGRKVFTAGEVLSASDVNGYLMDQSVMVFADEASRTSAIGTPTEGMFTYTSDDDAFEYWDGSAWQPVSNPGDITAVTAGTALTGGGTSGDVTLDVDIAVIATAVAGTALSADGTTVNVEYAPIATALVGTALSVDGSTLNVDYGAVGSGIAINATQIDYTLTSSTATTYTVLTADANKYLQFTNPATITVSTATDFSVGDQVTILADGTALTITTDGATIAGGGTTTTSGSVTAGGQYEAVSILCVASDDYRVIGNITAV